MISKRARKRAAGKPPHGPAAKSVFWKREGLALRNVTLKCPRCGRRKSFGSIYYGEHFKCQGRHPQNELHGRISGEPCGQNAKVMIRQAANLHLAETKTLLSIRSTYTELHLSLQDIGMRAALGVRPPTSRDDLLEMLDKLEADKSIRSATAEALRGAEWAEVLQAVGDSGRNAPDTYHGLVTDEFDGLLKASVGGAPPQAGPKPKSRALFELDPGQVVSVDAPNGRQFLIAPVQTLRTVTVQTGFYRDVPSPTGDAAPPRLVSSAYRPPGSGEKWYPGVELYGEGLFIRFKDDGGWAPNPSGACAGRWSAALKVAKSYPDFSFRDAAQSREELHPGFVWWHTLAHLLVRSISEDAGYSSSAIRERVYFKAGSGSFSGGILLYATQPGSDGTLGGLIALAPYMGKMLRTTLDRAAACSGDPLCIDSKLAPGGYNGASCYACSMNSETSCEHRNMWLDRGVLLENLP